MYSASVHEEERRNAFLVVACNKVKVEIKLLVETSLRMIFLMSELYQIVTVSRDYPGRVRFSLFVRIVHHVVCGPR